MIEETKQCPQCGIDTVPAMYQYICAEIGDGENVLYASIFDREILNLIKEAALKEVSFIVNIKSKTDLSAEIVRPSHILTKIAPLQWLLDFYLLLFVFEFLKYIQSNWRWKFPPKYQISVEI